MRDTRELIVFAGNATQDTAVFVSHLPEHDEVASALSVGRCHGGRGVVPALVGAALGLHCELCTVIGSDLRDEFSSFLHANGVGTSGVRWDDRHSGVTQYTAFIGNDIGNSVAAAYRPPLDWQPTISQLEIATKASAAYFSTNDLGFNLRLLNAVSTSAPLVHNLGVRFDEHVDYLDALLARATVIIGNRVEISQLTARTGLTPASMLKRSSSVESVIITAGRAGVEHYTRHTATATTYPAIPVDFVRSPVGAGDSLAVGVLWSLVKNRERDEGIRLGLRLSALAVLSANSYPDLRAVAELLR